MLARWNLVLPQYTAMFEVELGSNPAQTKGTRAKAKPRMLNKEGIFRKRRLKKKAKESDRLFDAATGDDGIAYSEGLSCSIYMGQPWMPTATSDIGTRRFLPGHKESNIAWTQDSSVGDL